MIRLGVPLLGRWTHTNSRGSSTDPLHTSVRSHSMMNKDHPFPGDSARDLMFRLAEKGAVEETRHAFETGHAFQGQQNAPLIDAK